MSSHVDFLMQQPDPSPLDNLKQSKCWRAYFNRRSDFPVLYCVDEGNIQSQIRVQWIRYVDVPEMNFRSDMGPLPPFPYSTAQGSPWDPRTRKGKANEPCVWLEFHAIAVFERGGATFYGRN